jgi:hypothetical protein
MGTSRRAAFVIGTLIVLAVIYQVAFRYEYFFVPQSGFWRVDRLTQTVCNLGPHESGDYAKLGCNVR